MAKNQNEEKTKKKKPTRKVKAKGGNVPSTQQFLPFAEIRDGVVIMKDGTLRRVMLVSSINFSLKSEDEQKGIIQGYVSFLNTIDFELQIVIQSRKLNIEKYLDMLDSLARNQTNELLKKQTKSYRGFVEKMVEDADIMDKKFFVVVPYSPYSKKKKGFWVRLKEVLSSASAVRIQQSKFQQYEIELDRRVNRVAAGLSSIGLKSQVLDTQAIIELYYNTYNPVTKQQRRIEDVNNMQVDWTLE